MPKQPEGENNTGLSSEENTNKKKKSDGFFSPAVFGIPFEFTKVLDTESWGSPWMWCYREVWKVFYNIKDDMGRLPNDDEVLNILDVGHSAFYTTLIESKNDGTLKGENLNKAKAKWSDFFNLWTPWFEEHYPMYFLSEAESGERYRYLTEKYKNRINRLLNDNNVT
jgi:hypothetical protein